MSEEVLENGEETVFNSTIYAKMVAAMSSIETLPKNGRNTHYNYAYVTDEDVMNAMRHALSSAGIAVSPSVRSVEEHGNTVMVWLDITFYSMDDGSNVKIAWPGYAPKSLQDKAATVAITNGTKYCLLKTFLVSTGDEAADGDSDIGVGDRKTTQPSGDFATEKQKGAIAAMLNKLVAPNKANVDAALKAQGFPPLAQLTKGQASELFKRLQKAIEDKEAGEEAPQGDEQTEDPFK